MFLIFSRSIPNLKKMPPKITKLFFMRKILRPLKENNTDIIKYKYTYISSHKQLTLCTCYVSSFDAYHV